MSNFTLVVTPPSQLAVTMAAAQGPAGPPGSGGDKTYVHNQMTASALWVVNHNLGKNPSVSVVDSAGSEVEGATTHVSVNQLTVEFSVAFGGKAYCN